MCFIALRSSFVITSRLKFAKFLVCFNDSSSKMMKNAFYFILKARFVLNIFKCLFCLFGHIEKTA